MILAFDTENDTYSKGSVFDGRFNHVCLSYSTDSGLSGVCFTPEERGVFCRLLETADVVVGFNLKYDLHVLRKLGITFPNTRYWCGQVAEFILGRQESAYPSLNEAAARYGLQLKDDRVSAYWAEGVQTSAIPREVLREYALHDAELHLGVYLNQIKRVKPHQEKLLSLHMQDLMVLVDMEWNGMALDEELSLRKADEIETQISSIKDKLSIHHSVPTFNWSSNDHLSALLYGGTISVDHRIPAGTYKSGKKAGEVRYKIETQEYHLPRQFKPIGGSETSKERVYKVDEPTLQKLGKSDLLEGILEIKKLEKLNGTYFRGVPSHRELTFQEKGFVHPQFNQCVTRTGRLSCVKPNLQNCPFEFDVIFISRF